MSKILIDVDTLLIGYFLTTGDVGVYRAVYPISNLVLLILSSFSYLSTPVISEIESVGASRELEELFQIITKWIFILTLRIVLLLVLFPRPIIGLTFGPEYVSGSLTLSVLSIGFFVHAIAGPNDNTLNAFGYTKLIMIDNIIVAVINVVLNLILIPKYSYIGAAIATAISYTTLNLLYSTQLYRRTGLYPITWTVLSTAGLVIIGSAAVYAGVSSIIGTDAIGMVTFTFLMLPVYVISILFFGGINQREIKLILDFEDRYGIGLGPIKSLLKWKR
jgi:O-antigen/teichoic acid export membrane protein